VVAAIERMKAGKAPGIDNVTVEELRAAIKGEGLKVIHSLFQSDWETEEVPRDWRRSIIIPIHKKQDKLDCSNYRGISLLSYWQDLLLNHITANQKTYGRDSFGSPGGI